jgi:hypothetical protein
MAVDSNRLADRHSRKRGMAVGLAFVFSGAGERPPEAGAHLSLLVEQRGHAVFPRPSAT